jgi:S1-C subfamily serine protease
VRRPIVAIASLAALMSASTATVNNAGAEPPTRECGSVGVDVRPMTTAFAASLGMAQPYGAIFNRPQPGGPAARAGIQEGDVLTAINGAPLANASDFPMIISKWTPGVTMNLTTWRNRQLLEIPVVLDAGQCPSDTTKAPGAS